MENNRTELPPDYKHGSTLLEGDKLADFQSGKKVTIQADLRNQRQVGELFQIYTPDAESLWARVTAIREGVD